MPAMRVLYTSLLSSTRNTEKPYFDKNVFIYECTRILHSICVMLNSRKRMNVSRSHASDKYAISQNLVTVEANKRISISKVGHRIKARRVFHLPGFSRTVCTRARREISVWHYREETIPSLSLNYFRALAGTCVRYGVMDDALGNPPFFHPSCLRAVSRSLRATHSHSLPYHPRVTLSPRGMPLE